MPVSMRSRIPQMEDPAPGDDGVEGYRGLVAAIVRQALADVTAPVVFAPGPLSPSQIRAEAHAWLEDETGLVTLLDLTGYDAAFVLQRVREALKRRQTAAVATPQLALFGDIA
jgi:hypothetical protein